MATQKGIVTSEIPTHPLAKIARLWQSTRVYHVQDSQVITSPQAASAPIPQFALDTNFPAGNIIYKRLLIRISGALSITLATGNTFTAKANCVARLIQSLTLRFANLDYVVNGLDGITLLRVLNNQLRRMMFTQDPVNIPAGGSNANMPFELVLEIPFQDPHLQRPEDTGIDRLVSGVPSLVINWVNNPASVFGTASGTGNTFNIANLNIKTDVEVVDPPNGYAGLPLFKPYYDIKQVPITQTAMSFPISLPFHDRRYGSILISQRDSVSLAELADTIVGVNDTDRLFIALNNDFLWNAENWLLEEHRQRAANGNAVMPAGCLSMDFMRLQANGKRIGDSIDVETQESGNLILSADVTNPGAGSPALYLGMQCYMTLKPNQLRPANLV